jgi:hypothetical protein
MNGYQWLLMDDDDDEDDDEDGSNQPSWSWNKSPMAYCPTVFISGDDVMLRP